MTVEIKVCMGSACFARGNAKNLEVIEQFIKDKGLDAKLELVGSHCCDKCAVGPNIYINDVHHSNVDENKALVLLEELL